MFVSKEVLDSVSQILIHSGIANSPVSVKSALTGGSINSCFRVGAGGLSFFLKVNNGLRFPRMFLAEAEGLKLISRTGTVAAPRALAAGAAGNEQFLLLEWIEPGRNSPESGRKLGEQLSAMHRHTNASFGLDHDNYMGSLEQSNSRHDNWADFFRKERIEPQLNIAANKNLIDRTLYKKAELLLSRLDDLFPAEAPALIHGDLWCGNYLTNNRGLPVLIDPAVTFGHREADIAMTMLFGGFGQEFYDSYNEGFPLQPGWEDRLDLWNLYPLLIHLNLFGTGYLQAVKEGIEKYI